MIPQQQVGNGWDSSLKVTRRLWLVNVTRFVNMNIKFSISTRGVCVCSGILEYAKSIENFQTLIVREISP